DSSFLQKVAEVSHRRGMLPNRESTRSPPPIGSSLLEPVARKPDSSCLSASSQTISRSAMPAVASSDAPRIAKALNVAQMNSLGSPSSHQFHGALLPTI